MPSYRFVRRSRMLVWSHTLKLSQSGNILSLLCFFLKLSRWFC
jgi:hypothetical protein